MPDEPGGPSDPTEDQNRQREEALALLLLLRQRLAYLLEELVVRFAEGYLTPQQFGDEALALLADAHTEAAIIGRRLSDSATDNSTDRILGEAVALEQAEFLAGFATDILAGEYGEAGALDIEEIQARASLYAYRLVGTANTAWTNFLAPGTLIWWIDSKDASECTDCADIAAGSPYSPEDLPTTPGAGDTACIFACRCDLATDTGQQSLQWED